MFGEKKKKQGYFIILVFKVLLKVSRRLHPDWELGVMLKCTN